MPTDAAVVLPFEDGAGGKLRSIIADNGFGFSIEANDRVQLPRNACARKRRIGYEAGALAGAIIDDAEHAKPAGFTKNVRHKIKRPALVGPRRRVERPSRSRRPLAAAPPLHGKAFFLVKPSQLFVVHAYALPVEHVADAAMTKPTPF